MKDHCRRLKWQHSIEENPFYVQFSYDNKNAAVVCASHCSFLGIGKCFESYFQEQYAGKL